MTLEGLLGPAAQLVLALIGSGVLIKVLTLRQDRRKIAGDASAQEANAASVLSGAALQMVNAAQATATAADKRASEATAENGRLWGALNNARWDIAYLEARERVLEAALRAAHFPIPARQERVGPYPTEPPPETGYREI